MDTGCKINPTELYDSLKNIAVPCKYAQKTSVEYVPLLKEYGAISSPDIFGGLISRNSSKLQCPVTYLQRVSEDNSSGRKYDRYEAYFTANMGQYSPICAYMKKNKKSDECNRCLCIDEVVADFLIGENGDIRTRDEISSLVPDGCINVDISSFDAHLHNDNSSKLYVRYVCEITGYTEIAVPFRFNGKVRGVFFSGQFIMEEVLKQTPDYYMNKLIVLKEKHEGDYNNCQYLRRDDEYNEWVIRNKISENKLQDLISDLFESLSGIKGELNKMLIAEVKHKIDSAHATAYETISRVDMEKSISRGDYYIPCLETMAELFKTAGSAFNTFRLELHCSLAVYLCEEIRVLEGTPIFLSRATSERDCQNDLPQRIVIDGKRTYIISDEADDKTDRSKWVEYALEKTGDFIWNMQPSASVATDYPVVTYINKSAMERSWRGKDEVHINEVVEYLEKTICGLANFVRSLGMEIVARFTAMRLASFAAVTRHEIGQKTTAMNAQLNIFAKRQEEGLIRETNTYILKKHIVENFLFDVISHVDTVSVMSEASRYISGVPKPKKTFFNPYSHFLQKWYHIFKKWEENYQCRIDYPTMPKNPQEMYGDAGQIEQVAFNLTGNAIKYSHKGTKTYIDCRPDDSNEWYIFETLNFATPINEEMQKAIFNYGQRGEQGIETDGDGLGLYISNDIALKHDGILTLRPTAARVISPYSIPMLYGYEHFIPAEWKNNDEMRKYSLEDDNPLTVQAIEDEIARLKTFDIDEFVREFLQTETIDIVDIYESYPRSDWKPSVFNLIVHSKRRKFMDFKESFIFYYELQRATAAVNFCMKIPYKTLLKEND